MPNGQMVYVLTTREGKEWRPVAVLDEMHLDAANQWVEADRKNNDWIPLEMNDMSQTDAGRMATRFKPEPPPVPEGALKDCLDSNARLISVVKQLAEKYGDKDVLKVLQRMGKQGSDEKFASELLRRHNDD